MSFEVGLHEAAAMGPHNSRIKRGVAAGKRSLANFLVHATAQQPNSQKLASQGGWA